MAIVQLVYAPLGLSPVCCEVLWSEHMTIADALCVSGLQATYPEIKEATVGIFARIVALDTVVKPGDRIEFYRPLLIDPKEKRRKLAKS